MSEMSGKPSSGVLTKVSDPTLGCREGSVTKPMKLLSGLGEAVLLDVPGTKCSTSQKCGPGHDLPRVAPKASQSRII
jgi:hypothetical protein